MTVEEQIKDVRTDLWDLQGEIAALTFLVHRLIAERCAEAKDPEAEHAKWLAELENFRRGHWGIANIPFQAGKEAVESTAASNAAERLFNLIKDNPDARYFKEAKTGPWR
jgi:hypothetical protein